MKAALSEVLQRAGEFFIGKSPIHGAAARVAEALSEMNIPFSIAGALAANVHGHMRTTEVVDILLTTEGLKQFKLALARPRMAGAVPGLEGAAGHRSSSQYRRDADR